MESLVSAMDSASASTKDTTVSQITSFSTYSWHFPSRDMVYEYRVDVIAKSIEEAIGLAKSAVSKEVGVPERAIHLPVSPAKIVPLAQTTIHYVGLRDEPQY